MSQLLSRVFMQGLPWEKADAYKAASPLYRVSNVRTPTIIHVGENDWRLPVRQQSVFFRALTDCGQSQLLVYPNATHGLRKLSEIRAKVGWDLAWFDHYVRKGREPANLK